MRSDVRAPWLRVGVGDSRPTGIGLCIPVRRQVRCAMLPDVVSLSWSGHKIGIARVSNAGILMHGIIKSAECIVMQLNGL